MIDMKAAGNWNKTRDQGSQLADDNNDKHDDDTECNGACRNHCDDVGDEHMNAEELLVKEVAHYHLGYYLENLEDKHQQRCALLEVTS